MEKLEACKYDYYTGLNLLVIVVSFLVNMCLIVSMLRAVCWMSHTHPSRLSPSRAERTYVRPDTAPLVRGLSGTPCPRHPHLRGMGDYCSRR